MKDKIIAFFEPYKPHYIPNIKLALPVVMSQAGQMVVGLADTLMVGQLGATQLAAVSFANSIFLVGFVLTIGLSIGLTPLVGKSYGAKEMHKCGMWLKQGLVGIVLFAIIQAVVMASIALVMPKMGQDPDVVKLAVPFYLILVISTLPFSVFMIFKQFAEGISNTRIAMVITLVANVINIFLNYIFIFGKLGMPNMGMVGAAWSTLISRILMPLIFIVAFACLPFFKYHKKIFLSAKIELKRIVEFIKVGFPIGGQIVIEVFAFSMGAIMMGWISKEAMAAHQIVDTIVSVTYMMSSGLASAATIKVSIYRGAKDYANLKSSAYAIIHKVIVFMATTGVTFILLRSYLPSIFTKETDVLFIATELMMVAGIFQIFDGLQAVWLGILRGIEDIAVPTLITFVIWVLTALPISYICAFVLKIGPVGIWIGYLSGLILASLCLRYRFRRLYRKMVKVKIR